MWVEMLVSTCFSFKGFPTVRVVTRPVGGSPATALASIDLELFVPTGLDVSDLLQVRRDAPREVQQLPPLPRDVRAEVPRVRLVEEARSEHVVDLFRPGRVRVRRRLDVGLLVGAQEAQHLCDGVALLFGTRRPVAERCRTLRTVGEERVREAGRRHSEERVDPFRPLVRERRTVDAAYIDAIEGACVGALN